MYVADMTLAEAETELAELKTDPRATGSRAQREQWAWDVEDLRERITELKEDRK